MDYDIRLPSITAKTPEGQIRELKSYLIQFVGQMNFILSDITKSGAADKTAAPSPLSVPDPDCMDFVVERGVKDGWSFRKFRSGAYEMHGVFEVTVPSASQVGSVFRTDAILVPVPFAINPDTVVAGSSDGGYWLTGCSYAGRGAVSIRLAGGLAPILSERVLVSLFASGTYAYITEV